MVFNRYWAKNSFQIYQDVDWIFKRKVFVPIRFPQKFRWSTLWIRNHFERHHFHIAMQTVNWYLNLIYGTFPFSVSKTIRILLNCSRWYWKWCSIIVILWQPYHEYARLTIIIISDSANHIHIRVQSPSKLHVCFFFVCNFSFSFFQNQSEW